MLELYHDMSTCAQEVRFALAEKGVSRQSRHVDLRVADDQTLGSLPIRSCRPSFTTGR
jgi:hypothetical protein